MYPGKNLIYHALQAPLLQTEGGIALIAVKRVREEVL